VIESTPLISTLTTLSPVSKAENKKPQTHLIKNLRDGIFIGSNMFERISTGYLFEGVKIILKEC